MLYKERLTVKRISGSLRVSLGDGIYVWARKSDLSPDVRGLALTLDQLVYMLL